MPAQVQATSNKIPKGARRDETLTDDDLFSPVVWDCGAPDHARGKKKRLRGVDISAIRQSWVVLDQSKRVRLVMLEHNHEKNDFFTILRQGRLGIGSIQRSQYADVG